MSTHPRAHRAFWGDIRFLIGLALVILSILGVWLIVSSARQTAPVLQANRTIAAGEPLLSEDFSVVEVALGTLIEDYLAPHDLSAGTIAARTVIAKELVPLSAVADATSLRTTNIVVESSVRLPVGVDVGTHLELWHSPAAERGESLEAPRILAADVIVASIPEEDGMLAQRSTAVELVIERADVAAVLAAIDSGASLSVVPLGAGS
ncbi:CpaB family protein [Microbacterium sp. GXF6406]